MLDDVEKKKGIFTVYPRIDRETLRFCSSIMSSSEVRDMAEYGEWNRKGATLSDVTAQKEYGVSRDFIVKGIRAGKLEYREGAIWGNPYLRVLRSQLEQYIVEELGADHLSSSKNRTELRKIKKEMTDLKKRLDKLQARRSEIENTRRK